MSPDEFDRQLLSQKLEAMAEFAAGAGHEINNPLATIIGRAAQLLKDETDPERRRMLEAIGAQAYRIRDMIGDAMLFARPPAPKPASVPLRLLVDEVTEKFQDEIEDKAVNLTVEDDGNIVAWVDRLQFVIVLSELLRNSLQAVVEFGEIQIRLTTVVEDEADWSFITVRDNGEAMSDEEAEHCFDPFYSGRQAGRGLGFGLSKAWRIVEQHHGSLQMSRDGDFTQFEIRLPRLDSVNGPRWSMTDSETVD